MIESKYDIFSVFELEEVKMNIKSYQEPIDLETHDVRKIVLEYLTLIPEQISTINLVSSTMGEVRNQILNIEKDILQYLLYYLKSDCSNELKIKSLKCLESWISFGIPIELLYSNETLFSTLFECLNNISLFPATCEVLDILLAIKTNTSYKTVLFKIMSKLIDLFEIYKYAYESKKKFIKI
jgi:hypothetical protein